MMMVISALLLFIYYFTYQSSIQRLEKTFQDDLAAATTNLEHTFHTQIENQVSQTLHFIRNLPSIPRYFNAPHAEVRIHRNELERLFINLHQSRPSLIKAISLFEQTGIEKIKTTDNRRVRQQLLNLTLAPKENPYRQLFEQLQTSTTDSVSSPYALGHETFIIGIGLQDSMFGSFNGMVVITFSVSSYYDLVSAFGFKKVPIFHPLDLTLRALRKPLQHEFLRSPIPYAEAAIKQKETFINTQNGAFVIAPLAFTHDTTRPLFILSAGVSKNLYRHEADNIKNHFLIIGLLSTLLLVGLTLYFARIFIYPVLQLHTATQQITLGNLNTVVPTSFPGELGALADAFNTMAQKLNDTNQQFLSGQQYTESILRSMHDALIVIDQHHRIKTVNQAFVRLVGYSIADIVNQPLLSVLQDADGEHTPFNTLLHTHNATDIQVDLLARDGNILPILFSASSFFIEQEKHIVLTGKDMRESLLVTELQIAKETANQANNAKNDFLSQMSHELRTPLNAILGFAQLLSNNPKEPLSANQSRAISFVIKGGETLLSLITDILDLSRIESNTVEISMQAVDVSTVLKESINLLAHAASEQNLHIHYSSPTSDLVKTDPLRLQQIILNLLSNAIKYNKPNGHIQIECEKPRPGTLTLAISDTGIGIPTERQAELFEPFNRLGLENGVIEGTGIGLSITQKLLELMGSSLHFKALPEGSKFWFELELTTQTEWPPETPPVQPEYTPPQISTSETTTTVLYIEDNPSNVRLMTQIFTQYFAHMHLIHAPSAELGITIAQAKKPQLIIMDINLPGMNGYQALKALSPPNTPTRTPVIALSANAMQDDIDKGLKAGFQYYLTKPINISEAVKVIALHVLT